MGSGEVILKLSYKDRLGSEAKLYLKFLPARRYAIAGLCDSDVSVFPDVCPSHAGIVPSRAKAGS